MKPQRQEASTRRVAVISTLAASLLATSLLAAGLLATGLLALGLSALPASAQASSPTATPSKKPVSATTVKQPASATTVKKKSAPAALENKKPHRVAVQVNANEPAAMNLALNNVSNVAQYYKERGEKVEIEIVAYGPGLHMLRNDTSPVKDRIKSISESNPNISFKACGNTQQNMQKAEAKDIPLVSQANVVQSGVVRLMELQERGWSYIRP